METSQGNKKYWNRAASNYNLAIKKNQVDYDYLIRRISGSLNNHMDVLELAAGTGYMALRLAPLCKTMIATDFSEEMIKDARSNQLPENLSFSVQDATNLNYDDNSFDAVIICHALHILPDTQKALAGIWRVLKDDGILVAPATVRNNGILEKLSEVYTKISTRMSGLKNLSIMTFNEYTEIFVSNGWIITESNCRKGHFPLAFVIAKKSIQR